jgi:hypothetical protein
VTAHKLAISLQPEVLAQVQLAADRLGIARSQYIAQVLTREAARLRDAEVTASLDAVYSDPQVVQAQRETAAQWDAVGSEAGTEW